MAGKILLAACAVFFIFIGGYMTGHGLGVGEGFKKGEGFCKPLLDACYARDPKCLPPAKPIEE